MSDNIDFDKLDELLDSDIDGLLDAPAKPKPVTAEDRLTKGFLEIIEFYRANGREPSPTTMNISERKLGARLDGFRASPERAAAVEEHDEFNLLAEPEITSLDDILDNDDLDLLEMDGPDIFDTSSLPEVQDRRTNDDAAQRVKSEDFEQFKHLFEQKHAEIAAGDYAITKYQGIHTIQAGQFFILGGIMAFIAEVGESEMIDNGGKKRPKERLRVIFENGTESSMYRQSMGIRLHEQNGRAITRTGFDASEIGDADTYGGHIYVLKSLSEDPQIAELENLYKIGFSRNAVSKRIANATKEPTYLMAPVEVIADYRVYNLRPSALENLLHRVFAAVRLNVSQVGIDGRTYNPAEWFVVPLETINQAIEMIISGDIVNVVYDPETGKLVEA